MTQPTHQPDDRAAFEAWFMTETDDFDFEKPEGDGDYCDPVTQSFWEAWQASRSQALEEAVSAVKNERLAEPQIGTDDDAYEAALIHAEEALARLETAEMTDAEIIAIRDACLPNQGEQFDCIAFARAIQQAALEDAASAANEYLAACEKELSEDGSIRLMNFVESMRAELLNRIRAMKDKP